MKSLYDRGISFPFSVGQSVPFENSTDKEEKCGARHPYPVIPLPLPRQEFGKLLSDSLTEHQPGRTEEMEILT